MLMLFHTQSFTFVSSSLPTSSSLRPRNEMPTLALLRCYALGFDWLWGP
jgi:hypothetical protein